MKSGKNKHIKPPGWADSILEKLCRSEMLEELQGDLHELFYRRAETTGIPSARRDFFIDVLKAYKFYKLKKIHPTTNLAMIQNYLKSTCRNLNKNRLYASVNILGLAIGIASFLVILIHVRDEMSFDKFHADYDRIFRFGEEVVNEEGYTSSYATSFYPLADHLKNDVPGVDEVTRIYRYGFSYSTDAAQITNPESGQSHIEDGLYFADSTFFDVFSFGIQAGESRTALSDPFSIMLTEKMAGKYFGNERDLIGRTLKVRDNDAEYLFQISGILETPPPNSHFQFQFLASFSSLDQIMPWMKNWYHPPLHVYAKLDALQDPGELQQELGKLPNRIFDEGDSANRSFVMDPITSIHLNSNKENELAVNGKAFYVQIFIVVAFLILFIACINFMNLATSNAARRAKEIGVRKTLGARRSQLIYQFLGESFFMSAIGFGLALLLVRIGLPYINQVLDKSLNFWILADWPFLMIMLGTLFLTGLLSGAYPSYFLSSLKSISLVKASGSESSNQTSFIRKGLVISQFVVSCALIVAVLVVQKQLQYMNNKDLGFNRDQLINVPLRDTENQMSYTPLKDKWMNIPGLHGITASSGIPTKDGLHECLMFPELASYDSLAILTLTVDEDFGNVYELDFVEGRDFSKDFPGDPERSVIINESAAAKLGWDKPIGQKLNLGYYFSGHKIKQAEVIGVVKDFNYHSLHKPVEPILLHMIPNSYYHDFLTVKFNSAETSEILASMEEGWQEYNSVRPFEYSFLDATFARLYAEESKLKRIFLLFSFVALFISCLGLFALSSYTCATRTKEIGIRKIMGASSGSILLLLSNQFGRLVGLAFILSLPLSWYASKKWLDNFAYHVDLNVGIFIIAGVLAILVSWLTIIYHAWRAATTNPINTLRDE